MKQRMGKVVSVVMAMVMLISLSFTGCSSCGCEDQSSSRTVVRSTAPKVQMNETNGLINMDKAIEIIKNNKDPKEIEKKLNEIYTGDGIISLDVRPEVGGDGQIVTAFIDMDEDGKMDGDTEDDKLFSCTVNPDKSYVVQGYGRNSYYHSSGSNFWTGMAVGYMVGDLFSNRGYRYSTSYDRLGDIYGYRSSYRSTPSYKKVVVINKTYYNNSKTKYGTKYNSAQTKLTPARKAFNSKVSGSDQIKGGKSAGSAAGTGFLNKNTSSVNSTSSTPAKKSIYNTMATQRADAVKKAAVSNQIKGGKSGNSASGKGFLSSQPRFGGNNSARNTRSASRVSSGRSSGRSGK